MNWIYILWSNGLMNLFHQTCQNIAASILVKRHMSAMYVKRDLVGLDNWRHIWEPTLVKNHTHVMCVTKHSLSSQTCQHITASIQVKSYMSVMYVRRGLVSLETLRNTWELILVKRYKHVVHLLQSNFWLNKPARTSALIFTFIPVKSYKCDV